MLERRIYVQLSYRYRIIVRYASDDSAPILVPVFAIVDLTNLSQSTTWAIEEEGNPFPELDDVPLFAVLRSKSAALPDSPEMDEGGHDLVRAMVGYRIAVATLDRKVRSLAHQPKVSADAEHRDDLTAFGRAPRLAPP